MTPETDMETCKEIDITPAMVAAGIKFLVASGRLDTNYEEPSDSLLVRGLYRTMESLRRARLRQSD